MQDFPQQPMKYFYSFTERSPFCLASIIKFPPRGQADTYKDLVCTEQDKANIYELIVTLADNNKLNLLLKQSYIKNLGAQINHVHPLKFLSAIFGNADLKVCMQEIFSDYFKRAGFMEGLSPSMGREHEKGKVEPFLNDFAAEMGIPIETMRKYFQSKDWENLVYFLIQP